MIIDSQEQRYQQQSTSNQNFKDLDDYNESIRLPPVQKTNTNKTKTVKITNPGAATTFGGTLNSEDKLSMFEK